MPFSPYKLRIWILNTDRIRIHRQNGPDPDPLTESNRDPVRIRTSTTRIEEKIPIREKYLRKGEEVGDLSKKMAKQTVTVPVPVDETGATVEVWLLNVGFVDHQQLHDVQVGHEAR